MSLSYLDDEGLAALWDDIETRNGQIWDDVLELHAKRDIVYGFHIDSSESDPAACVTYIADAVGMKPAKMNYTTGTFDWGTWRNAFFIPRPCMLKPDGTVDFYLNENDYTLRADGTPSHVGHLGDVETSATAARAHATGGFLVYDGALYEATADIAVGDTIEAGTNVSLVANAPNVGDNAMMEWGQGCQIWTKTVPDTSNPNSVSVYIADRQIDPSYHAWSFIGADNNLKDHFYTPIYNGTLVNDGTKDVLRSLGGMSWETHGCQKKFASNERTYARNNGTGWDTEVYADVVLINDLLTLMGKSLNTQAVFGQGLHTSGSETVNNGFTTGVHNAKGLFFGTNSGAAATYTNAVKVFGMENWWGFQWRRFGGYVAIDGTVKYKLTRGTADGSSASDYVVTVTASDYSGYLVGDAVPEVSGKYIKHTKWHADGSYTPVDATGDSSHYYCDALYTSLSGVKYAYRGGGSDYSLRVGAWYLALYLAPSYSLWSVGASPSYKPQS